MSGTQPSYTYDVDFCTRFLCGYGEQTESNASVFLPVYHMGVDCHALVNWAGLLQSDIKSKFVKIFSAYMKAGPSIFEGVQWTQISMSFAIQLF